MITVNKPSLRIVLIALLITLFILVAGAFALMKLSTQPLKLERSKVATQSVLPQQYIISYNADGSFAPQTLTVKSGDLITLKNDSKVNMQIAFGEHENHTPLKGFEEKLVKPSESYTFRPEEKGSFDFHNHLRTKIFGKLVVN